MKRLLAFLQRHGYEVALLGLVALVFLLRYDAVWYGFPIPTQPDEPKIVDTARRIMATGDWNPHFFNYPSLLIYLSVFTFEALERVLVQLGPFASATEIPAIYYYVAVRHLVLVLSMVTLWVVYAAGRAWAHPIVGLLAAAFLGFSHLHLEVSYVATVDQGTALTAALVLLFAHGLVARDRPGLSYLSCGVAIGLAMGFKYTVAMIGIVLLIGHVRRGFEKGGSLVSLNLVLALFAIMATFLITTPYALLDLPSFWDALEYERDHYRSGHIGAEADGVRGYGAYAGYLLTRGFGIGPMIAAAAGVAYLALRRRRDLVLLGAYPLIFFVFMGSYKVVFMRNMASLLPFLALFAGLGLYAIFQWLRDRGEARARSAAVAIVLLAALSIAPILPAYLGHIAETRLPYTQVLARDWAVEHLPEGAHIAREFYTPPLEVLDRFEVTELGVYGASKKFNLYDYDYVLLSSRDYGRFFERPDRYPREHRIYQQIFEKYPLLIEIAPEPGKSTGPTIKILDTRRDR